MHRALSSYVLERTRNGMLLADRLLDIVEGKLVITEQRVVVVSGYSREERREVMEDEGELISGSREKVVEVKVAPTHRDVLKAIEQLREMALGEPMKAEQLAAAHAKAELEAPASKAIEKLSEKQLTRVLDVLAELPADATPADEES